MSRHNGRSATCQRPEAARLRRSAGRAAGGGDADREAESDDDDERIAKLEAIEHGEVDWDDGDVYSLGRGQSWSSVDHLV